MTVITPPTYRDRYYSAVVALIGKPVIWRMKGPDAFDCSGSVTYALKLIGGPDLTLIDNAQALHNETRLLRPDEAPLKGDLVYFGLTGPTDIEHVATYDEFGGIISADGATSQIDPKVLGYAAALARALANPSHRVRTHNTRFYRKDTPYIVVHRNVFVDRLDQVER